MRIVVSLVALSIVGCGQAPDDCPDIDHCLTSGTGAGTGATGGSSSSGGGSGGLPEECVPSKLAPGAAVPESCNGVFVDADSGNDANDGSAKSPLKSLTGAVSKSGGNPIYVCAAIAPADAGV